MHKSVKALLAKYSSSAEQRGLVLVPDNDEVRMMRPHVEPLYCGVFLDAAGGGGLYCGIDLEDLITDRTPEEMITHLGKLVSMRDSLQQAGYPLAHRNDHATSEYLLSYESLSEEKVIAMLDAIKKA